MNINWKFAIAPALRETLLRRAIFLANFVFLVLIAQSAATITWLLIPAGPQIDTQPSPSASSRTSQKAIDALALSREIANHHLFGVPPIPPSVAANTAQPAVIPETRLNLVLRGIMAWDNPKNATAIIADPAGKEAFYTIGQELPGGGILKEVHQIHIVLQRNGRYETLKLPKEMLGATTPDSSPGLTPNQAAPSTPPSVAPNAGAKLREYRDAFMKNPDSLSGLLNGEPVREGNQLIGYRLQPGRDPTAMAQFGLLPGDVVTAINGMSLSDPGSRMAMLRSLESDQQINVTILRNNAQYNYTIRMDQ